MNSEAKDSEALKKVTLAFLLPEVSPVLGKVKTGDFLDLIGVPDFQSDEFKSGDWPDLLLEKVVAKKKSHRLTQTTSNQLLTAIVNPLGSDSE